MIGLFEIMFFGLICFVNGEKAQNITSLQNKLESLEAKTNLLLILASHKEPRTRDRQTPLHLATIGGQLNIVKLIWSFSTNKEPRDINGSTPLHLSAKLGTYQCFQL